MTSEVRTVLDLSCALKSPASSLGSTQPRSSLRQNLSETVTLRHVQVCLIARIYGIFPEGGVS